MTISPKHCRDIPLNIQDNWFCFKIIPNSRNIIIKAVIHRGRPSIISTYIAAGVIHFQPFVHLSTELACKGIAVIGVLAVTHEPLLPHVVSGNIISQLVRSSADADVVFL